MIINQKIEKPRRRSNLRKFLGKEFFTLKRRINWWFGNDIFAKINLKIQYDNSLIKHKSFLLRPLKDVEMYLQHNKITNLKIAIRKIDKVVIKPGQKFSKVASSPWFFYFLIDYHFLIKLTMQNFYIRRFFIYINYIKTLFQ
jgi:hypothetical protein